MTKQQLRLEELAEQGRQMAKHSELKPKPRPEGRGMAFAMAHLDELLERGKLQKQAREVASPQEPEEVFHGAVDPSDNEESIWMDAQAIESTEIGEVPDVTESEPGGGEQAIGSTDIAASTHVMESDHGGVQEGIETEIGQIGAMPFTHEHGGVQEAIETEIGQIGAMPFTHEHGPCSCVKGIAPI